MVVKWLATIVDYTMLLINGLKHVKSLMTKVWSGVIFGFSDNPWLGEGQKSSNSPPTQRGWTHKLCIFVV